MNYNPLIAFLATIGILGTTAVSSYALARKNLVDDLVSRGILDGQMAAGIGLSANTLSAVRAIDTEIETASFLYEQAKRASEEGEWLRVKALLDESAATQRIDYEQYAAALLLLGEATEKVAGIEARVAGELAALRDEAARETAARKTAEVTQQKTATQLVDTQKAKAIQEAALLQKLSTSEEQKKAAELRADAEELAAFVNELDVYVSLLVRGETALRSAEGEIDAGRDAQSLVYLNQAEDLFAQVEIKGTDLRDTRTPAAYRDAAGDLLRAAGVFKTAAKTYRGMVALLPEKGDGYDEKRTAAIAARLDGSSIAAGLVELIAALRR